MPWMSSKHVSFHALIDTYKHKLLEAVMKKEMYVNSIFHFILAWFDDFVNNIEIFR